MMLCMMKKKNEWGNWWKSRPPNETGVRLESRASPGGRGSAMMGAQFGTKPAYAALGLCCRGLVLGRCWWELGMELHEARAQDLVRGVRVVAGRRGEGVFFV